MAIFVDYFIEALFDGEHWINIGDDIVGEISVEYGIFGNGPMDRVAGPGSMTLYLNNTARNSAAVMGYYTPGGSNCRGGFDVGLKLRLRFVKNGFEVKKWSGKIPPDGIEIETGRYAASLTKVTVRDWMEDAAQQEIENPQFVEDKTINDGVAALLEQMNEQPENVVYKTPQSTFRTLFDIVKSRSKVLSQFSALAISELGYIYQNRFGLIIEGRYTRTTDKKVPDHQPILSDHSGRIKLSQGGLLLNSNGGYILLQGNGEASFDNAQEKMSVSYGKTLANRLKMLAYPRKVDEEATTTLYTLQNPIYIESGATVILQGTYSDPSGVYKNVAGIEMVDPLPTTHYLANALRDGTGSNLTAYLDVTATLSASKPVYELHNSNASGLWVTKLIAVGKGVYTSDPTTLVLSDDESIAKYNVHDLSIDMKYQDDPSLMQSIGTVILSQYKEPHRIIEFMSSVANLSDELMSAFLFREPGDRIAFSEEVSNLSNHYFIQGIKFTIKPGGVIPFTWYLKEAGFDGYNFAIWDVSYWDDGSTWGF